MYTDYRNNNPDYGSLGNGQTDSGKTLYLCGLVHNHSLRMEENKLNIETVHQCNCCLGCKTLHPLVSVIELTKMPLLQHTVMFGFYTVLLREGQVDEFFFGRRHDDYSDATLLFLPPGQSLKTELKELFRHKGWLLAFHPDLIHRTSLGTNIRNYTFFSYRPDEALHVSMREKTKAVECLFNIREELRHAIDCHSQTLISRYIELLLDYCSRFYERQFITREEANKDIMRQTETFLDQYILSGALCNGQLPSLGWCAGHFGLSSCYFTDLLKFETGKTFNEYLQFKRFECSKSLLLNHEYTPSQVAALLGYPNVQYFTGLFKKITGITPNEYRFSHN